MPDLFEPEVRVCHLCKQRGRHLPRCPEVMPPKVRDGGASKSAILRAAILRVLRTLYPERLTDADIKYYVENVTGRYDFTEATIGARRRDLRKPRYGGHKIERRERSQGVYEYRLSDDE